jgi:hypothetical protein
MAVVGVEKGKFLGLGSIQKLTSKFAYFFRMPDSGLGKTVKISAKDQITTVTTDSAGNVKTELFKEDQINAAGIVIFRAGHHNQVEVQWREDRLSVFKKRAMIALLFMARSAYSNSLYPLLGDTEILGQIEGELQRWENSERREKNTEEITKK